MHYKEKRKKSRHREKDRLAYDVMEKNNSIHVFHLVVWIFKALMSWVKQKTTRYQNNMNVSPYSISNSQASIMQKLKPNLHKNINY
jgi:hypothetical protein